MMRIDWNHSEVVKAYATAFSPHGDFWRQALVNPTVLQVLRDIKDGGDICYSHPLDLGLAEQRNCVKEFTIQRLQKWHTDVQQEHQEGLNGLSLLDVGCGEGYLYRWLAPMGVGYAGIDGSRGLIKLARQATTCSGGGKKRTRNTPPPATAKPSFHEIDLDSETVAKELRSRVEGNLKPNLIVATIIIDHLKYPERLLAALSSAFPQCPLLLFTLNPDYFKKTDAELNKEMTATIASAAKKVQVVFRSKEAIDCLMRASRYVVRQHVPLHFGRHCPKDDPCQGIAPFLAFLAEPLPPPISDQSKRDAVLFHAMKTHPVLSKMSEKQKLQLGDSKSDVELIHYANGQTVLAPRNVGGDLYVVVDGKLQLKSPRSSQSDEALPELEIAFDTGDILGELETDESDLRCGYYIYPVRAINGVDVLRLPQTVVGKLLSPQEGLHGQLFKQLRDRLSLTEWQYQAMEHNPKGHAVKPEHQEGTIDHLFYDISWRDVDNVSRAILRASQAERLSGRRDPRGRSILIDTDTLAKMARKGSRPPINEALRVLMCLNIADAFPGDALHRIPAFNSACFSVWDEIAVEATNTFFGVNSKAESVLRSKGLIGKKSDGLLSGSDTSVLTRGTRYVKEMTDKSGHVWTEAWKDTVDELLGCDRSLVRRWLTFLFRFHSVLFEQPGFIYIHDMAALQSLATEDVISHLVPMVRTRFSALGREINGIRMSMNDFVKNHLPSARVLAYLGRLVTFARSDLLHDKCQCLEYSGLGRGREPIPMQAKYGGKKRNLWPWEKTE